MKNLHILPTDKPSRLVLEIKNNNLFITTTYFKNDLMKHQNIYITSDSEIKKGDWYFDVTLKQIIKANVNSDYDVYIGSCQKVILTTDQDLIADGIQPIDNEFLEWFVKDPSCEEVKVSELRFFNPNTNESAHYKWEYDLSKEEPKHITVKEPCSLCDGTGETTFSGTYTTQRKCDLCNGEKYWNKKILVDQPKQERVEEAAERLCPNSSWKHGFIAGANYQAERMYSESIEFAEWIRIKDFQTAFKNNWIGLDMKYYTTEELFEQFKKK
jgi:hypothetical protein